MFFSIGKGRQTYSFTIKQVSSIVKSRNREPEIVEKLMKTRGKVGREYIRQTWSILKFLQTRQKCQFL